MNIFIDAQLPKSLKQYFPGENVIHTNDLDDGSKTKDLTINDFSINDKYVVISKDSDS